MQIMIKSVLDLNVQLVVCCGLNPMCNEWESDWLQVMKFFLLILCLPFFVVLFIKILHV